jgi:succinoglycan biosynthesis protein ExoU
MMNQSTDHPVTDHKRAVSSIACVDVLIAARDRADTIERAVLSALAQDEVSTVIVVDDGSIDDTAACARGCDRGGKRVIVERLPCSVGPAAARNIAIGMSATPWLAVLDADDFFRPGRIGALLSQSSDGDFVADDLVHVRENLIGQETPPFICSAASIKPQRLTFEQFVLGNVTRRGSHRKELGYLKPLIRREFLDRNALLYNESLRLGEDYVLYARALAAGARFLVVPMPGYVAVEREDSLSARHTRQDLEALRNSDRDLMADSHLTRSEREVLAKHYADVDRRTQWLVFVEALQSRNYRQFVATLFGSPTLTLYLGERLFLEMPMQIKKCLRRLGRH